MRIGSPGWSTTVRSVRLVGVKFIEPRADALVVLSKRRRWKMLLSCAGIGVVVEAEGRARKLDPSCGGMLDLDKQSLGPGLVPTEDVVESADFARGNPCLRKFREQGLSVLLSELSFDGIDEVFTVGDALFIVRIAWVVNIEPRDRREPVPQRLTTDSDLHG